MKKYRPKFSQLCSDKCIDQFKSYFQERIRKAALELSVIEITDDSLTNEQLLDKHISLNNEIDKLKREMLFFLSLDRGAHAAHDTALKILDKVDEYEANFNVIKAIAESKGVKESNLGIQL